MEGDLLREDVVLAIMQIDGKELNESSNEDISNIKNAIKKEYRLVNEELDFVIEKVKKMETNFSGTERVKLRNTDLLDPISLQLIQNPFSFSCGHSFSENTITQWLLKNKICPICQKPVTKEELTPNQALKAKIKDFEDLDSDFIPKKTSLSLVITPEFDFVSFSEKKDMLVMASIYAPPETKANSSVSIIAVVDKSSNDLDPLEGKLRSSQSSLRFLLSRLKNTDSFGLLSFSKDVKIDAPPALLVNEERRNALKAIDSLQTEPGRNLKDAVKTAVDLAKNLKGQKYIVIFTDAHDISLDDSNQIKQFLSQTKSLPPIYVLGFANGKQIDSKILSDISNLSRGLFYFSQSTQELEKAFGDFLGGVLSVFASDVKLKITLDTENLLGEPFGVLYPVIKTTNTLEIEMGDISYDEEKNILFRITLPSLSSAKTQNLVSGVLEYFNLSENKKETSTMSCTIQRPEKVTELQKISNFNIDKHRNRVLTAEAMLGAIQSKSPQKLQDEIKQIFTSISCGDWFCQCLISTLSSCFDESTNTIKLGELCSFSQAHLLQRSTQSLPLYSVPKKASVSHDFNLFLDSFRRKGTLRRSTSKKAKNITLKDSVRVPKGINQNDWFFDHVLTFRDVIKQMWQGNVAEKCTPTTCPSMTIGPSKEPKQVAAHEYIDNLFEWIDSKLRDDQIFPSSRTMYPKTFLPHVKKIFKRLIPPLAHFYYHHLEDVKKTNSEQDFLRTIRWFYSFLEVHNLVDEEAFEPLNFIKKE